MLLTCKAYDLPQPKEKALHCRIVEKQEKFFRLLEKSSMTHNMVEFGIISIRFKKVKDNLNWSPPQAHKYFMK